MFYKYARNTPKGSIYFKPKKTGAMWVSSWGALWALLIMNIPMYLALALLAWRLAPNGVDLITETSMYVFWALLAVLFVYHSIQTWKINAEHLREGVPELEKYSFRQVA